MAIGRSSAGEGHVNEHDADRTAEHAWLEVERLRTRVAELERQVQQSAEAGQALQRRFDRLTEVGFEAASIHVEGVIVEATAAFERMFGLKPGEAVGLKVAELAAPESVEVVQERIGSGFSEPFEAVGRRRDGTTFVAESRAKAITYEGKSARAFVVWDITDRKRAEETLRRSEATQRAVLRALPDLMFRLTSSGVFVEYRAARSEDLYAPPEAFIGANISDVMPGSVAAQTMASIKIALETGDLSIFEYQLRIAAEERDFEARVVAVHADEVLVIVRDFTQRNRAERALAEESERLLVTLRSIGEGVIATDEQGRIVLMNRVAEQLTGWGQAEARGVELERVFRIVSEGTREPCTNPSERILAKSEGAVGLGIANGTVLIARDGTERAVSDCGAPIRDRNTKVIGTVLVFRDVTDQRRIASELQRMDKLESIGVLAGGIAHDFNNILTVICGNVSMLHVLARGHADMLERLTSAEHALARARGLTHRLLTFAKGGAPAKRTTSIAELLKDTISFGLVGSRSRCELHVPAAGIWSVDVDEGQIAQVVQNLLLNADQAMPGGGVIQVAVENVDVAIATPALPVGRYVRISISDRGVGIPRERQSRIFDPYFTTKPGGSGLGLAICASILRNHQGSITVNSEPGSGTTFHAYLPASEKDVEFDAGTDGAAIPAGKGTILVLDDDPDVRATLNTMLKWLGYGVTLASSGEEAIALWSQAAEQGAPFSALILDLVVPGAMGGKEVMRQLAAASPDVKAIVVSGYSDDTVIAQYEAYGFRAAIPKPFTIEMLAETLCRVLG
jgi:PAS domain S-box-containing protein